MNNRVWVLGWYVDKANTIELMMKEETDRWILKQRVGGKVVGKAKAIAAIEPNVEYIVQITFDGNQFTVSINQTPLMTYSPVATVPIGTIGFESKITTARFGYIQVE